MNRLTATAALALFGGASLLACSGDTENTAAGPSRAEIQQIVQAELAKTLPDEPGITRDEVDRAIHDALEAAKAPTTGPSQPDTDTAAEPKPADPSSPDPEVTSAKIEEMIRYAVASIPPRSDPAAYTKFVVDNAVSRYDTEGLAATVDYYSRHTSIDGQWYVFIVDDSDTVIAHYNPDLLGLDIKGPVGTDINGYNYGAEMRAATGAGRWVPYVYVNPVAETLGDEGVLELKNAWVVRHDGLLFGSGWYIDTEEFAPELFSEAAEHYRRGGMEAFLEFTNDPTGISTGLIPVAEYYNRTDTLEGFFTGIVADPNGKILAHIDPNLIGTDIEDLLGPAVHNATAEGGWITAKDNPAESAGPESMRMWLIDVNGTLIGGGWYRTDSTR